MKNNNHHTVPKGYLKFFAILRGEKSKKPDRICVFNKGKVYCNASIQTEGTHGKYYSSALEDKMAKGIETEYPKILSDFITNNFDRDSLLREREKIGQFVGLQVTRTPKTKESVNSTLEISRKNIDTFLPPLPRYLSPLNKHTNGSISNIYKEEGRKMVRDFTPDDIVNKMKCNLLSMEMDILSHSTNRPFITSDNPVVCWNPFLNERIKHNVLYKEGLNTRGLIILLPVHSRYCVLYYDPMVYKTRKSLHLQKSDVNRINELQYMSSDTKVYFSPEFKNKYFETYLQSLSEKFQKRKQRYKEKMAQGNFRVSGEYISFGRVEQFSSFCTIPNFLKYTDNADSIDLSLGKNWFR